MNGSCAPGRKPGRRGGESVGLLKYQAPFGSNPRHAHRHCHTLTSRIIWRKPFGYVHLKKMIKVEKRLLKIFIFLEKHLLCGNFARHRDLLKTSSFYKTNPSANQFNNPQNKIN